jgi:type I restriction enzyme S subunit
MTTVPQDWVNTTLEDCCEILDRKRIPVNGEDRETRIGEVPYYGANGLQGFIDGYIFDEPLILIAEDGGRFDEYAERPIAYRISGRSWVNNHAHVLRAKDNFCQDAVFYTLEHKDIQAFIVGGTRSKLNQSALKTITVQLPSSKPEQTKIAEILSTVDRAIEQTEALIAKQQRIKTGLMQDLLTRGIDEKGNLRSEQTHKFKDSPLGRIPVEWEVKPIESKLQCIIDYRGRTPFKTDSGIPLITAKNVREGFLCEDPREFIAEDAYDSWMTRGIPEVGDVMITTEAPMGNVARVPGYKIALAQRLITLPTKTDELFSDFLFWMLHWESTHDRLELLTSGSTVVGIKQSVFRKVEFCFPRLKEQQRIAALLNAEAETQLSNLNHLSKLRSLKTGLMQDLLTGRKRVTDLLLVQVAA